MDEGTANAPRSVLSIPVRLYVALSGFVGGKVLSLIELLGGGLLLFFEATRWMWRALTNRRIRLGMPAIVSQMVRVGVRSVFIVSIVSGAVGLILALQLAPPLDDFGQKPLVANIIGVAVFRELGPLIGAVVLTGFAGAAIAAEIGTMVVSEEIEAPEAHALNPIRFLVVPRVAATIVSMTALAVISDLVSVSAALGISVTVLDIPYTTFMTNLLNQTKAIDFFTGVSKGAVFGALIGIIACANGLKVSGGAAGVGNATTQTVVQSVVAIIFADLIFTAVFYFLHMF